MLTDKQKKQLEEEIYKLMKAELFEAKSDNKKTKKIIRKKDVGRIAGTKKSTLLNQIDNNTVNKAGIAYQLYNSHSQADKDADRSLFYKKLHNEKNDNGVEYEFSDSELNKIKSIIDKQH